MAGVALARFLEFEATCFRAFFPTRVFVALCFEALFLVDACLVNLGALGFSFEEAAVISSRVLCTFGLAIERPKMSIWLPA
ncbi:MAG: hypothetical protein AAFN42_12365 [Cyanobacteria bacterium J06554_1]